MRQVTVDFHIHPSEGMGPNDVGIYYPKQRHAAVCLNHIHRYYKQRMGTPVPEYAIIEEVETTVTHEVLHSLIVSSGPDVKDREHRAIARLMFYTRRDL